MATLSYFGSLISVFSCFRLVYDYCTIVQKNNKNKSVSSTGTAKSGGAELIGQELYKRLKNFLENYLIELLKVRHTLLNHTINIIHWNRFSFSFIRMNRVAQI